MMKDKDQWLDMLWAKNQYSEEKYKTDFEVWMENSKLQFERENIESVQPPLDSTPVGAKKSDSKTAAIEYSELKEK